MKHLRRHIELRERGGGRERRGKREEEESVVCKRERVENRSY